MKGSELVDELIIKLLIGDATEEEAQRVVRWREERPENEARFQAVRRVWTATDPTPLPGDADLSVVPGIVHAARERDEAQGRASIPHHSGRRIHLRLALPLAAALGAISLGVYQWSRGPSFEMVLEPSGPGSETYALDDGSFVRLARGSRLAQLEGGDERRFELQGQALFAVARLQDRPFTVVANGVETRVLGTRFEVRSLAEGAYRIAVLEGRVEVRNEQGRRELSAGDISLALPGEEPTHTRPEDIYALLDWPEGSLLFQNTPLAQVAREIERQYGARVEVEGEALQTTGISAWYDAEPFRVVVESLCAATRASCTVTDTLAILR